MSHREAKASWRSIVKDIYGEAIKPNDCSEAVDNLGDIIERVAELRSFRRVRLAESRQVGCNNMGQNLPIGFRLRLTRLI
jgi:hypothetical protein